MSVCSIASSSSSLPLSPSIVSVSCSRLRGYPSTQLHQQDSTTNELISFLQSHQAAFEQQAQQPAAQAPSAPTSQDALPSLQAQQVGNAMAPQGATDASPEGVLAAVEHSTPHSLIQAGAKAKEGEEEEGEKFGPCKTCVFVLERIKKGTNMLLPAICSELYHKYPDAYALCHQVLNALSINGNNVRYWLFEGCYKYEIYQSKEWIKPCPSHVMCSVLKDLSSKPFCPALPMENPFKTEGEGEE